MKHDPWMLEYDQNIVESFADRELNETWTTTMI